MKKWVSVLLSASMVLAVPVSAFAAGLHNKANVELKVKGEKVEASLDGEHQGEIGDHDEYDGKMLNGVKGVLHSNLVKVKKVSVDGLIDSSWDMAKRVMFFDASTGLEGYFRFMWDKGDLYVLAELKGAAKLWKETNKPTLVSLFYNGDLQEGDTVNEKDGYLAVSWPDMAVLHGKHDGCLKVDSLVKAYAVKGDDVNVEFKIPWVSAKGVQLTKDTELGLFLALKQLPVVQPDINGKVIIPAVSEQQVLELKPVDIPLQPLQLIESLVVTAPDQSGNSGTGTGGTTSPGSGSTGAGGTTTPGSNSTGTGGTTSPDSGTAVGGVSDTGVIPSAMPQTGEGGASEWTD